MNRAKFLIFLLLLVVLTGCSGLDKTDQQIIDTAMNNSSKWNLSDTFNMNFTTIDGTPGIRTWNGGSGIPGVSYAVKYCYYTIDYENNSVELVDSEEKGVNLPDSLRYGNEYPKSGSEETKRKYLEDKYKVWKKANK